LLHFLIFLSRSSDSHSSHISMYFMLNFVAMYVLVIFRCYALVCCVTYSYFVCKVVSQQLSGIPYLVSEHVKLLQGGVVSPTPNPQPGGPGLCIYNPRRQGGPVIPLAPGTHLSRLLRHMRYVGAILISRPPHGKSDAHSNFKIGYQLLK
jgi:hypothetical protein